MRHMNLKLELIRLKCRINSHIDLQFLFAIKFVQPIQIKSDQSNIYRVSVGITVDAPVSVVSNKTNDLYCFKGI